jgi:hypothetical protein
MYSGDFREWTEWTGVDGVDGVALVLVDEWVEYGKVWPMRAGFLPWQANIF